MPGGALPLSGAIVQRKAIVPPKKSPSMSAGNFTVFLAGFICWFFGTGVGKGITFQFFLVNLIA